MPKQKEKLKHLRRQQEDPVEFLFETSDKISAPVQHDESCVLLAGVGVVCLHLRAWLARLIALQVPLV